MKKNLFYVCLAAGLAFGAAACSVQEPDSREARPSGGEFFARIEASSEQETKVYADDRLRILWDADDRITIFNKYTYNQEYRFIGRTGDNAGSFKKVDNGDFITGNALELIYAVYPYRESTSIDNDGILTVTLPDSQSYREQSFGRGANTMISCTDDNQLFFKNLCGYMSLRLYGENVTVSSISIKGNNNEPLAGDATVQASLDGDPSLSFTATATDEITLVTEEPVALGATSSEAVTFWFVVPPTTFAEGFTLTVTDPAGNVFTKSTTRSFTIGRNSLYRMSALNVSMAGATDLSSKGTANSYIVPSAGIYKFKADVKGNGFRALDGKPASAEVIWETFNTDTAPQAGSVVRNVRFQEGYVHFETPGNAGNALIAVKDDAGTILWSWHIWATSYNPETEFDTYLASGAEMMNRNLGALSNTPGDALANGLMYQWGRKDPFLSASSTTDPVLSAATPEGVANQMVSGARTVDYATQHPTHFIDVYDGDWMDEPDYTLWGPDKTQYDPCPPGWKVPSAGVFASWGRAPYDYDNHGITFGGGYSSPAAWYPFSGQLFGGLWVGEGFDLWTITTNGSAAVSPHASWDYFDMNGYYDKSGFGQSVRCVRESYQELPEEGGYIDEYGVNRGAGITLNGVTWAPVNCGYKPATAESLGYEYGKLYQWGRKDGQGYAPPMYNADDTYRDEGSVRIVVTWQGHNEDADKDTFYYGRYPSYNWIGMVDPGFWNLGTEDAPVKNLKYDPCPEGWRVPTMKEMATLLSCSNEVGTLNGQAGRWFFDPQGNSKGVFFPYAGTRFSDQAVHSAGALGRGDIGQYWNSSYGGITVQNDPLELNGGFEKETYLAFGNSVRCVADDGGGAEWDGLRLKATSDNTVLVKNSNGNRFPGELYYSFDTQNWTEWEYDTEIPLAKYHNVYLKGNKAYSGETYRIQARSGSAYASGYVCSLFENGTDYTMTDIPDKALQDIFQDDNITGELWFPDVVKKIGTEYLFGYTCHGNWWSSVLLPKNLEFIGGTCFEGNTMTEITLPGTLTFIGNAAFNACYNLEKVYFTGTVAQWEAVTKRDYKWGSTLPATKVICTDGEADF